VTRRLPNLLCLAVCGLWLRGHWRGDQFWYPLGEGQICAYSNRGCVLVEVDNFPTGLQPPAWEIFDSVAAPVTAESFAGFVGGAGRWSVRLLGFALGEFSAGSLPVRYRVAVIPYWFLALLFAAAPIHWARVLRLWRRHGGGHCRACGYDLRATPGRCPECGTPAAVSIGG